MIFISSEKARHISHRLATIHPWHMDGQTDRRIHDNSYNRRLQHRCGRQKLKDALPYLRSGWPHKQPSIAEATTWAQCAAATVTDRTRRR